MIFIGASLLGLGIVTTLFFAGFFEPLAIARPFVLSNIGIALWSLVALGTVLMAAYLRWLDPKISRFLKFGIRGGLSLFISSLLILLPITQLGLVEEVPEWKRGSIRNQQNTEVTNINLRSESISFDSYLGDEYSGTITHIEGQYSRNEFGRKPSGYISILGDTVILAQGDGSLIALQLNEHDSFVRATSIPSNLDDILDSELRDPNWFSIKGIHANNDHVYLSVSKRQQGESDCWNTAVLRADLDFESSPSRSFDRMQLLTLEFYEFFVPEFEACSEGSDFNAHMSGGAMAMTQDGELLLSIGAYKNYVLPQIPSSTLGKILALDTQNAGEWKLVAKGVRNPQNFLLHGNQVFFPEQGPEGGDELNVLNLSQIPFESKSVANFGWPIASIGKHYNDALKPFAPLVETHEEVPGLEVPLYEWQRSLGLSSITSDPWVSNQFFLGSMGDSVNKGDMSLLRMGPSEIREGKYEIVALIPLGFRVRDILVIDDGLLLFTDEGKFISLEKTEEN